MTTKPTPYIPILKCKVFHLESNNQIDTIYSDWRRLNKFLRYSYRGDEKLLEFKINPNANNICHICGNIGQKVKEITVVNQLQNQNDICSFGE